MQQRALGRQGLAVSAIGLGTMGMTMAYGPSDEQEGIKAIRRAYELGVTFFDTAELCGRGTGSNEALVGQAVAPFRDEVVIPGTRDAKRVEENGGAADVMLTDDDLRQVTDAFPEGAYGERYAEASLPNWV